MGMIKSLMHSSKRNITVWHGRLTNPPTKKKPQEVNHKPNGIHSKTNSSGSPARATKGLKFNGPTGPLYAFRSKSPIPQNTTIYISNTAYQLYFSILIFRVYKKNNQTSLDRCAIR